MTDRVWYAAYGSNLSLNRFGIYLRGGTPLGAAHNYPGCRDTTGPREMTTGRIDRELVFGGGSKTWGGGVAFVDPDSRQTTLARLYLVTIEQFADVVAQENWLEPGSVEISPPERELDLGEMAYGLVLGLGEKDGDHVLTVTRRRGTAAAAPSLHYLRHIASGLSEAFGMTVEQIAAYLGPRRGIAGAMSPDELAAALP